MGYIFVSYSSKDIVYAEKLINALRREGFNPWLHKATKTVMLTS